MGGERGTFASPAPHPRRAGLGKVHSTARPRPQASGLAAVVGPPGRHWWRRRWGYDAGLSCCWLWVEARVQPGIGLRRPWAGSSFPSSFGATSARVGVRIFFFFKSLKKGGCSCTVTYLKTRLRISLSGPSSSGLGCISSLNWIYNLFF